MGEFCKEVEWTWGGSVTREAGAKLHVSSAMAPNPLEGSTLALRFKVYFVFQQQDNDDDSGTRSESIQVRVKHDKELSVEH